MKEKKETTYTGGKKSESSNNESDNNSSATNTKDIIGDFVRTSSNVVEKATMILEEEVAAGIIAAKKLEKNFIDPENIRTDTDEELMRRFRTDAHDVIDIMMDAATVVSKYGKKITKNLISIVDTDKKVADETITPTLVVPGQLKPGESSEVVMTLENNSDSTTEPFSIISTDLVNLSGGKINSLNISVRPKQISIKASQKFNVSVIVKVPLKTVSGSYSGLLLATNLNNFKAILVLNVADNSLDDK